jgi:hypoxanthine phosphoribosyltransferase
MCRFLAETTTDDFTAVVGLSRGGLIPATIIANYLNIRHVYSIGLASYNLDKDGKMNIGKHDVYQQMPIDCRCMKRGERVLIVDDISDKGTTFQYVMDTFMNAAECETKSLSIFIKPETTYIPDMYYGVVPQDYWITFPWETNLLRKTKQ